MTCVKCGKPLTAAERRHYAAVIEFNRAQVEVADERSKLHPDMFSPNLLTTIDPSDPAPNATCVDCDVKRMGEMATMFKEAREATLRAHKTAILETVVGMISRMGAVFTAAWMGTTGINIALIIVTCLLIALAVEMLVLLVWRRAGRAILDDAAEEGKKAGVKLALANLARIVRVDVVLALLAAVFGLLTGCWWVSGFAAFGALGYWNVAVDVYRRVRSIPTGWLGDVDSDEDDDDDDDAADDGDEEG